MIFWLILCGLVGLTIGGIVLIDSDSEMLGIILALIAGSTLCLILLIWPMNYFADKSTVVSYEMTRRTIEESRRSDISDLERATLTKEIVGINRWLKQSQYWNEHGFDAWIPDEVMELEPLR